MNVEPMLRTKVLVVLASLIQLKPVSITQLRCFSAVCLRLVPILLLNRLLWAQTRSVEGRGEETIPLNQQTVPAADVAPDVRLADSFGQNSRSTAYVAKIGLSDGAEMLVSPTVTLYSQDCKVEVFLSGTIIIHVPNIPRYQGPKKVNFCPATFMMPGYRSATGVYEGQVILLRRLGLNEGSTVSITILSAPKQAKKAYSSGELAIARQQFARAIAEFRKAVHLYPKHAAAWSELGRALELTGHIEEAEQAYRRASAADPMYLKPYFQLAALAADQKRWDAVLAATDPALKLNPVDFPGIYFFDAIASMNLGNLARAEQSARKSIDVDKNLEFPRAYMVLGTILLQENDSRAAIAAFRNFLKVAPPDWETTLVKSWVEWLDSAHKGN